MNDRDHYRNGFADRINRTTAPAFQAPIAGVHALAALGFAVMYLAESLRELQATPKKRAK